LFYKELFRKTIHQTEYLVFKSWLNAFLLKLFWQRAFLFYMHRHYNKIILDVIYQYIHQYT